MAKPKIKKAKRASVMVRMVSTAGTGYTYFARKNPLTITRKMLWRKFDPKVNQYVIFEEKKMKRGKKFSTMARQTASSLEYFQRPHLQHYAVYRPQPPAASFSSFSALRSPFPSSAFREPAVSQQFFSPSASPFGAPAFAQGMRVASRLIMRR